VPGCSTEKGPRKGRAVSGDGPFGLQTVLQWAGAADEHEHLERKSRSSELTTESTRETKKEGERDS